MSWAWGDSAELSYAKRMSSFSKAERSVERVAEQLVETEFGPFRLVAYQDHVNRDVHLALVRGVVDGAEAPLVRVHLTDTLRDLIGVHSEHRTWTLRSALARVATHGTGIVIILREQESPRELADAVRSLGSAEPADSSAGAAGPVLRTYGIGAQILKDLGVRRMQVLSAPKQMHGISAFDLEITGYLTE